MGANKTVIILGGGLAGLAAAVVLAEQSFQVTIIERRPFLGGRASSYPVPQAQRFVSATLSPSGNSSSNTREEENPAVNTMEMDIGPYIDNCQHILMKCCTNLLDFYSRLSVEQSITFFNRFNFLEGDGKIALLKGNKLPAPFHLLSSFLSFHPLRWRDKLSVAYALGCMVREHSRIEELDQTTMLTWLQQHKQAEKVIDAFWRPILVSALNEDIEIASARYGVKVFIEGFMSHPEAYHMGVPRVPLGKLYTEPCVKFLSQKGCHVHLRETALAIEMEGSKVTGILTSDGSRVRGDYYVSSVPPEVLARLVPIECVENSEYFKKLRRFESSPITSIYLWFDRGITNLENSAILGHEVQWLFKKNEERKLAGQKEPEYFALVVSASRKLLSCSPGEIVQLALKDLHDVLPSTRQAQLLHSVVLKEPFATFSCRAGCDEYRLDQETPLKNFYVAGDWTNTGWPPTMEGAVRSSYRCAELILEAEGRRISLLRPDLPPSGFMRWLKLR